MSDTSGTAETNEMVALATVIIFCVATVIACIFGGCIDSVRDLCCTNAYGKVHPSEEENV